MLFHLSFLYSYSSDHLNEIFKKCCRECLLSKPLVSLNQNGTSLEQFDTSRISNGKQVYNDLVEAYKNSGDFKKIISDFDLFFKSCQYFKQNGLAPFWDDNLIKIFSTMNKFEVKESEAFSDILKQLDNIQANDYSCLKRTTETLLERLQDVEENKIIFIKISKGYFDMLAISYEARRVLGEVKFTLTEEDNILLNKLINTVKNLEKIEKSIEKIDINIKSKTTSEEIKELSETFEGLAHQIEFSFQEIKYTGNKYLQFLEIESEIKFEEYLAIQARLKTKCDLLEQKFKNLGYSVPEKIPALFDSNLEIKIIGFTQKAEQLTSNFVELEKELAQISFNTCKLSIFQRIRYFLMNKYEVNCIKLHDLEQEFLLLKSELQCLLNTYDTLKMTVEKISKQSDLSSKQDILLKYHSSIAELISSDLIEMNGSNLKVKDKIKFEEKVKVYTIESIDIKSKVQKMRWIYLIVTFSIFLVFLCLVLPFIYYKC